MSNAQKFTTDVQATELGFTHKVVELATSEFFSDRVTYFKSENDARAFTATRLIGDSFLFCKL